MGETVVASLLTTDDLLAFIVLIWILARPWNASKRPRIAHIKFYRWLIEILPFVNTKAVRPSALIVIKLVNDHIPTLSHVECYELPYLVTVAESTVAKLQHRRSSTKINIRGTMMVRRAAQS